MACAEELACLIEREGARIYSGKQLHACYQQLRYQAAAAALSDTNHPGHARAQRSGDSFVQTPPFLTATLPACVWWLTKDRCGP